MPEHDDINEDNIEKFMHDNILDGLVDIAGITEEGRLQFSISEKGENYVIQELMGGHDVADNTQIFMSLLVKHGFMGFDISANLDTFLIIASCMKLLKTYNDWTTLTIKLQEAK